MPARPTEVMQQAAEWVVKLRSPEGLPAGRMGPSGGPMSPPAGALGRPGEPMSQSNCTAQFGDWLRASPLHVREYLRAVEIWEGLSHPDAGSGRSREQLIAEAGDSNLVGVTHIGGDTPD